MITAMLKAINDDSLFDCDQVSILEQITGRGSTKLSRCRAPSVPVLHYVSLVGIEVLSREVCARRDEEHHSESNFSTSQHEKQAESGSRRTDVDEKVHWKWFVVPRASVLVAAGVVGAAIGMGIPITEQEQLLDYCRTQEPPPGICAG